MSKECRHDFKVLTEPIIDLKLNWFGGSCYVMPPIYQCKKCLKVFKTGDDEHMLVEIPIWNIEKQEEEYNKIKGKRKKMFPLLWILLMFAAILFILGVYFLIYGVC